MPGRKQRRPTESEKTREYRLQQARGYGDTIVGERGAFLDEVGDAAEVRRERERWKEEHE